jgi:hypothetical protein
MIAVRLPKCVTSDTERKISVNNELKSHDPDYHKSVAEN